MTDKERLDWLEKQDGLGLISDDGGRWAVPGADWRWFGTSGHFICGQWCRFHLCTQVGDYLVSTVGEYVHPRHSGGSERTEAEWLKENWPGEDIGCDRKYETMVFRAGKLCERDGCECGLPELASPELDSDVYNERGAATKGHLEMCRKLALSGGPSTSGREGGE